MIRRFLPATNHYLCNAHCAGRMIDRPALAGHLLATADGHPTNNVAADLKGTHGYI
jgi:hypothetical protein